MYGAYGVLAALHERDRTGVGTVVRTSLLAAVVGVHAFQGTRWTVAGEVGRAQGNHHPSIAPYGLFHCRDGAVQIAVGSEGLWRRFCEGFGLDPEADGLATNAERVADRDRHRSTWSRRPSPPGTPRPLLARLAEAGVPGRQGAHPGRGLRVGPDRQPGPAGRRRPPHPRSGDAARPAAAVLRSRTASEITRRATQPTAAGPAPRRRSAPGWTIHRARSTRRPGDAATGRQPSSSTYVLDPGSFESWDAPIDISPPHAGLPAESSRRPPPRRAPTSPWSPDAAECVAARSP